MKKFIKICLALCVFILIVVLINNHDNKVNQAAEYYEECVKVQYNGMTPSYYYEVNGEYPECK